MRTRLLALAGLCAVLVLFSSVPASAAPAQALSTEYTYFDQLGPTCPDGHECSEGYGLITWGGPAWADVLATAYDKYVDGWCARVWVNWWGPVSPGSNTKVLRRAVHVDACGAGTKVTPPEFTYYDPAHSIAFIQVKVGRYYPPTGAIQVGSIVTYYNPKF